MQSRIRKCVVCIRVYVCVCVCVLTRYGDWSRTHSDLRLDSSAKDLRINWDSRFGTREQSLLSILFFYFFGALTMPDELNVIPSRYYT